jgi:hypothetical protein
VTAARQLAVGKTASRCCTQQGNCRSHSRCRFSSGGVIVSARQLGDHAYLACTIPLISMLASRSQSAASSLHDPSSLDGSSSLAPAPLRLGTLNIDLGVSRKLARVVARCAFTSTRMVPSKPPVHSSLTPPGPLLCEMNG